MTETDGQTPSAPDPVADLVQAALAVALALTAGTVVHMFYTA